VNVHAVDMGGVYSIQSVEKPNKSQNPNAPKEIVKQEVLEKAPAYFGGDVFLENVIFSQYAERP
jgi:hypothetical protein